MGRAPLRFAFEAAFLIAVGVALAAADLDLLPFVVVMAVTWVLVALAERMLSRPGAALPSFARRASEDEASVPVRQARVETRESHRPEPAPAPDREREVDEHERQPQRTLEAVPEPEPIPEPEPEPEEEPEPVAELPKAARRRPDGWNLWDLELQAKQRAGEDPLRDEEWHALFVSLREFAQPDGTLPSEFDALVRESFEELISRRA